MKLRRVLRSLGVTVLIATVYFFVSLLQVWNTGRSADRQPVDAIVVLGAAQYDGRPSPQLQARLDHALELWNLNLASYIVVTGGKQEGDRFTEAATSRKFFESSGVASDLIFEENSGTTTYASLVAAELGMAAEVSATRDGVVSGSGALRRNVREALGIMVGRITGFRDRKSTRLNSSH